jgi:hypothetical protein
VAKDDGSVLIPVIAVMAVGLTVGALLSLSVVRGMTISGSTRVGLQSQAAADAGVAAARAGLYAGNCTLQATSATYTSTGSIYYSATVQRMQDGAWQAGCPANLTPQIKVLSTGRAVNSAGQPYGTPTTVEAIYNFVWPVPYKPSGVGMYLYGNAIVAANSALDLSENGGLVIKNGSFTCSKNNAVLNGNVVVAGNLVLGSSNGSGSSCTITGSAWVSGAVTLLKRSSISGNLTAGSVSPNPPGSLVGGTYTQGGALPAAAPWADVAYGPSTPSDWAGSTGTTINLVTLPTSSGVCSLPTSPLGIAGQTTMINALACTGGIQTSGNNVMLAGDVVIFANSFSWGNSQTFASSSAAEHRLWFVTPDNLANAQPTCSSSEGPFTTANGFTILAPIDAMLYTPCAITTGNNFTWKGQIYAGSGDLENNPSFQSIQIGMPGFDFGTGTTTSNGVTTPQPGTLVSNRNINVAH